MKGWRYEGYRHSLAARGISTKMTQYLSRRADHLEEIKAIKKEWNESERGKEMNRLRDEKRYGIAKTQEEQIAEELGFDKSIVHDAMRGESKWWTAERLEQKKIVRDEYLSRRESGEISGGRLLPRIIGSEDVVLENKEGRGMLDDVEDDEFEEEYLTGGEELFNKIMTPSFISDLERVGRERVERDKARAAEKLSGLNKIELESSEGSSFEAELAREWIEKKKKEPKYDDILGSANIDKLDFVMKKD